MVKPDDHPVRLADRAAFRAWAGTQPRGRWERHDGLTVAMATERVDHTRIKALALFERAA